MRVDEGKVGGWPGCQRCRLACNPDFFRPTQLGRVPAARARRIFDDR